MIMGAFSWAAAAALGTIAGAAIAALAVYINRRAAEITEVHERRDLAREEAVELATVRGEAIADLHRELDELKTNLARERDEHLAAVSRLQRALDLARDQSLETQQMLAHGVRALLIWILGELEKDPPHVDVAVREIRAALNDSEPRPPGQRRRAA